LNDSVKNNAQQNAQQNNGKYDVVIIETLCENCKRNKNNLD
jgi:hypothetical protein